MAQENTKLCDFSNTNNNVFIITLIAHASSAKSYEVNAALLNLVMKEQFSGLPSEDAASHLNTFVELVMSTTQLYSCRFVLGLQAQSFVGQ